MVFYYDADRNITSIIDKATGNKATGEYMLGGFEDSIFIKVAGGKLSSGKAKLSTKLLVFEIIIDKDYGIGVLSLG